MTAFGDGSNDIVSLNVGGVVHTTTIGTLRSVPSSMLARMFATDQGMPTARDAEGRVFLDRDGSLFRHVLNYLRDRSVPQLSARGELRAEARYFGLEQLEAALDSRSSADSPVHALVRSSALTGIDIHISITLNSVAKRSRVDSLIDALISSARQLAPTADAAITQEPKYNGDGWHLQISQSRGTEWHTPSATELTVLPMLDIFARFGFTVISHATRQTGNGLAAQPLSEFLLRSDGP
eukprot:CAMPEP_0204435540 /NCGR_PEP_ID=MMETSP0470-20130426/73802_1 /ASSEMBLY_ACC=CAM_ASM_000385 /TAXON_ID=2969 /ORGANISM="Oxyrrhis marina" /LENGTH=237 /DNA_ID=CAMNT_0051434115 /DNA_START=30 /DNA_END=740 /DNA_ORIENTATION=+